MERRPLGQTGLQVTDICFGTSGLGDMPETYGYEVGEERARATVRAILDGPANFLDTANNYGMGRSEERIGAVIRERGGLPDGLRPVHQARPRRRDRPVRRRPRAAIAGGKPGAARPRPGAGPASARSRARPRPRRRSQGAGGALEELFRMKEEGLAQAVGLAMGQARRHDADPARLALRRAHQPQPLHAPEPLGGRDVRLRLRQGHRDPERGPLCERRAGQGQRRDAADRLHGRRRGRSSSPFARSRRPAPATASRSARPRSSSRCAIPRITSTIVGVTKPERVAETLDWAGTESSGRALAGDRDLSVLDRGPRGQPRL